jgi:hypothetical protein
MSYNAGFCLLLYIIVDTNKINISSAKIKSFGQKTIMNGQNWTVWIYQNVVLAQNEALLTTCQVLCLMDKSNPCNVLIFDSPNCYLGNSNSYYFNYNTTILSPTAVSGSYGKLLQIGTTFYFKSKKFYNQTCVNNHLQTTATCQQRPA